MADIPTTKWSETAASNTSASPDGWPSNSAPTIVYSTDREMMGAIKREWNRNNPTVTSSGTNTVTLTYTTAPAAYVQGMRFCFIVGTTNTGATTLNVNSLGATNVFMDGKALVGGEMVANSVVECVYDGTQFQIISSRALGTVQTGNKNYIINGAFDIWQRGAGGSASIAVAASVTAGQYTADRWYLVTGANQASTVSQQAGLTNGARWDARIQRNSGQTGTAVQAFGTPLTTDMICGMRGSIITVSCWVRSGANWSPTSGALTLAFITGTGSEAKLAAGFTGQATAGSATLNLGTSSSVTLMSFTTSAVIPTNTTQAELRFTWTPTGTASTNDYFEVSDVQIEIGGLATAFERRPFADELARCKRFFHKTFLYSTAPGQGVSGTGAYNLILQTGASGSFLYDARFPVIMRAPPTVTTYNPVSANANWRDGTNSTDKTVSLGTASDSSVPILGASGVATSQLSIQASFDADL